MKTKRILLPLAFCGTATGVAQAQQTQPNIVVILTDDLGFSDPGCYGGEIQTPTLDRLAAEGVRFTQMYNSARSCPSRACLMTGLYPHQVGVGEMIGGGKKKLWPEGYSGFRDDNNLTIAEALRTNGYYTAMAGKWHLGQKPNPVDRGFEDFYGLLGGFTTFWDQSKYTRLPNPETVRVYPEGEYYSTDAITDYAIEFAGKAREQHKPLFLYLSYNAPHFPLHAPKERIDKYMETYMKGWDAIRAEREQRLRKLGLLPDNERMSTRGEVPGSAAVKNPHEIPAWDSLTADQQKDLARRMAIYAAMVDIMDENIGRFLASMRENGQLDNTLIIFMSDNGACAEWHEFGFDGHSGGNYHTHVGAELDGMGQKDTYHHYGTGWANVCCAPFFLYKHFAHEGGISTPSILWWGDKVKHKGSIDNQPCHFSDIMTTCLVASGTKFPETYEDRKLLPLKGISILPIAAGKKIENRPIFAEHEGNRMVRVGDWKLVASYYNGQKWELYNIARDRTEQHNLADKYPEKVAQMEKLYFEWADANNVLPYPQLVNKHGGRNLPVYNEK